LIDDKACDSNVLDEQLAEEYGIEMISPDPIASRRRRMDPLCRYRRHWKVERLFAWMQNYRRLVARCEDRIGNFLGFVQLACLLTLLKHL
jgi:transposase